MQMNDEIVTVPVEVEHTASVPVDALNETPEPELDPNRLIEADVQLQREEQETERARIAARTAVKIAQINAEEPPEWQNAIQECLTRLTALEAMMIANQQSSTPTQSTVVVTEPEAPIVEETTIEEPPEESAEVTPEPREAPEAEAPARPRRRWI